MSYKFSQNLRNRLKRYFENRQGLIISDELADEYLESLSELYLSYESMCE